jgi:hypothetical protein
LISRDGKEGLFLIVIFRRHDGAVMFDAVLLIENSLFMMMMMMKGRIMFDGVKVHGR